LLDRSTRSFPVDRFDTDASGVIDEFNATLPNVASSALVAMGSLEVDAAALGLCGKGARRIFSIAEGAAVAACPGAQPSADLWPSPFNTNVRLLTLS
jgi:hypothetical protein